MFGPERKNTYLEDMANDQIPQKKAGGSSKKIMMPKLSGRAAQIMASSNKQSKKRNENEFRSQGMLEVQEILDMHESKYGSAIGDQLDIVQE